MSNNPKARSKTTPSHIKINERRMRGFELKRAGASWTQVAEKIATEFDMPKFTRADAYNDYKALMAMTITQPVEEHRAEEIERLNTAQIAIWNQVMRGDLAAIDTLLKIIDKRAKFQGTYAPTKIAGHDGGPIKFEVVGHLVIKALIARIDQIELPSAVRVELLDGLRDDFLAIEGEVEDTTKDSA